jgi:hypothetical protein
MTSIQRAAAYLKKIGPKAALAIVPLAAATVPAQASLMFTVADGGYATNDGSLNASWSATTLAGTLINGVHGAGASNLATSGLGVVFSTNASGGGIGTFPSAFMAVEWDFTLYTESFSQLVTWSVDYNMNGTSTQVATGSDTITTAPTNIADSFSLPVTSGAALSNWSMFITLNFNTGGGFRVLHFDVDKLDIAALDAEGVPEPSTFLLAGPLVGFLLFRVRQRKR